MRAAYEKQLGRRLDLPEDRTGPARAADGTFAPKEAPEEAARKADKEEQPEKPVASKAEESKPDKETTARHERALTALRRAQIPQKVIDSMTDEDVLATGTKLAEGQAKTDALIRSKTETRKDPASPGTPDAAHLKKLAETLALDEDGAKLLEAALQNERAPLSAEITELRASSAHLESTLEYMLARDAQAQLIGEFPELKDKEVAARVRATMNRLADQDGVYDHIEDVAERFQTCMRDALILEAGPAIRARMKAATKAKNEKQNASSSDLPKKTDQAVLSDSSPTRMAWDLLKAGEPVSKVKALVEARFN